MTKLNNESEASRRHFLQMLGAGFGMLAGLGRLETPAAGAQQDYKALVCVFLFGGNDGHNVVVPLNAAQYSAYQAARGGLALPTNQLLPINDATQGAFGLHYGLPELQQIYQAGRLAVLANVGMLVRPTSYAEYIAALQLPTNLRSHSDQVLQMQTGIPNSGGSTGWGGRTVDLVAASNANTSFPVSISIGGPSLYCTGNTTAAAGLQPGNDLSQGAMNFWPASAAAMRDSAQARILAAESGNALVDAANRALIDARLLNPLLKAAAGAPAFSTQFPSTSLGNQMKEIARLISLRTQLNAGRQVFFCSMGGFDTHSNQSWTHWDLLQQVSKAVAAFYQATVEMGVADRVTTFTLSDFGRTLQPSGSGTDHGWGSHHLILGGAVRGGRIFGRFPRMTNYSNFNATAEDYVDARGGLLPQVSLAQYGATLARWFGAADAQLNSLFPQLANFSVRDLGFME